MSALLTITDPTLSNKARKRLGAFERYRFHHPEAVAPVLRRALPPRQVVPLREPNSDAAHWRAGSCLDRDVPLFILQPSQSIISGLTPRAYYKTKLARLGTLGPLASLNPFLAESKVWP